MSWQEQAAEMKFKQGKSWGDLKRAFPEIHPEKIRAALRRMPEYQNRVVAGKAEFIDLPDATECDVMDYWQKLQQIQALRHKTRYVQSEAVVTINDDKPIGIVQTGDWHIGAEGFDFETFNEDIDTFKRTDGLYLMNGGDGFDNESPGILPKNNPSNLTDRDMQLMLHNQFCESLSNKWLAFTLGCHPDWDVNTSGKDPIEALCRRMQKPYFQYGGTLYIDLNGIEYSWMIRHKYRAESKDNPTNAQRVMTNSFGKRDVASLAHLHFPDMQVAQKEGDPIVYLRSGSYKVGDVFGRKIGGYKGTAEFPMVIFYPDQKKMIPFRDYRDGLYLLKELRK
jgi:hypothetical protein